jgi:hypothetical protein
MNPKVFFISINFICFSHLLLNTLKRVSPIQR